MTAYRAYRVAPKISENTVFDDAVTVDLTPLNFTYSYCKFETRAKYSEVSGCVKHIHSQ